MVWIFYVKMHVDVVAWSTNIMFKQEVIVELDTELDKIINLLL